MVSGPRFSYPLLSLLLIVGIFYLNFTSRIALAPLLPIVEADLRMGHGEAGSLFFTLAFGYAVGLLGAGFVSSVLAHRKTITLSAVTLGFASLAVSRATSAVGMHACLFCVGLVAGLYLPSGIATLTDIFPRQLWGRAIAVHEMGPNLGFITVPLLSEALLRFLSWRGILALIGASSILFGILFFLVGRGGMQKGAPPSVKLMRQVLSSPPFGTMLAFFAVSIGCSMGVYAMTPLFLVREIGIERELANTYIGFARIFGTAILFLSGIVADRLGARKTMVLFLTATSVCTLLIGLLPDPVVTVPLLFLQAASVVCLFPVGFMIISVVYPVELRSTAVSLIIFAGFLLGGGVIPLVIGYWAESFSFSSGFFLLGLFVLCLVPLFLRLLRLPEAMH